jgi:hypothetical protein
LKNLITFIVTSANKTHLAGDLFPNHKKIRKEGNGMLNEKPITFLVFRVKEQKYFRAQAFPRGDLSRRPSQRLE